MQAGLPFGQIVSPTPSSTSQMWFDPTRGLVVYDTPEHAKLCQAVPAAVHLGEQLVAFPATIQNLQVARWLGYAVPPVMDTSYSWPGRYKPFTAQRLSANFLVMHPRAFCLSDMGTGKTLAILWAADFLMQHNPGLKALVVAPLSTLQRVWSDALFTNFTGRRSGVVLHGDQKKRRRLLDEDHDFYIINPDGLPVIHKELSQRKDIGLVVIDEAAAYRDRTTERHKLARKVLQTRPYIWLATGTPTPNGPLDAFGLALLVNGAFGESWASYQGRTTIRVSPFVLKPRQGAQHTAHQLLRPAVRFAIEDCVDLPPCTVQKRDVELSPEQTKAYVEMKRDLRLLAASGKPINAVNEAVLRLKLIQISCGVVYGSGQGADRELLHVNCAPRLKVLREVLAETKNKAIIFAPLTSVLHMLHRELKEFTREIINGEVSQKDRAVIFNDFQSASEPRLLIADPATMAHGLTLTAASGIIWYAPTDRTELYLQANKRIDRPGQTTHTTITQLAATPIEREIYRRLEANETMQGLILQLAKG